METEKLIKKLVEDQNSKPQFNLKTRMLIWTIIVLSWLIIGIFFGGNEIVRADNWAELWVDTLLITVAAIFSGFTTLLSTSNTYHFTNKKRALFTSSILLAIILLTLFLKVYFTTNPSMQFADLECSGFILLHSLVPGIFLYGLTRGLGEGSSKITAFFCIASSVLIGAIVIQFACLHKDPLHQLVFHIMPIIILGILGIIFGRQYFTLENKISRLIEKLKTKA